MTYLHQYRDQNVPVCDQVPIQTEQSQILERTAFHMGQLMTYGS